MPEISGQDLLNPLQRYWGFDAFRPMQESVVRSLLEGRDVCVVMPTGGGKSLCYQLPAVLSPQRTAIVVSPLIALMQDQVAQLSQMGIPAAVLNSTMAPTEQAETLRNAQSGAYRLLYLSPERLAREDTLAWMRKIPVAFFVIDEAHCISEWGHEFRPEYRQLSRLRLKFPEHPIAAFTASATRRVRHDIVHQLQLRDPHKCIASFYRPNLKYVAHQTDTQTQSDLLLKAVKSYAEGNVIVYAPTIAKVNSTVALLEGNGIPAVPYHGQMEMEERRSNQERWMADEVRVLVGTIAFGLGINKGSVRAVIHLSLPKSIEQYYQEAGRGGRDGLAADCVLLWQKRDAGLLAHFIGQIEDPTEKDRAWQRYREIRGFAESKVCRHHQICSHFGETRKSTRCAACDVCGFMPSWLAAPVQAEQLPKNTKSRKSVSASSHSSAAAKSSSSLPHADLGIAPELREQMREWRRNVSKEQKIPAFVILHDSTLDRICQVRPSSIAELLNVSGIGERKAELYGREIVQIVTRFCSNG